MSIRLRGFPTGRVLLGAGVVGMLLIMLTPEPLMAAPDPVSSGTFQAVDGVELENNGATLTVTGILQGQATQSAVQVRVDDSSHAVPMRALERCERLALLSLTRPGEYLFHIAQTESYYQPVTCRLTRRQ